MHFNIPILITIIYVILALTGFVVQFVLANLHHLKQKSEKKENQEIIQLLLEKNLFPAVSVIFPIYNEKPEILQNVLQSAEDCLSIPNLEVIVVDDCSTNLDELQPIYDKFQGKLKIFYQKKNTGKREAHYLGFTKAIGEYVITVDSDTLINRDGILTLLSPILKDEKVGAVTGDVRVKNETQNLLTRLIAVRYWLAFNLERAAQSFTGSMLCCSGPFSVYRKSIIDKIKDDYISQTFFGKKCTFGDDRHLTNLVLAQGYKTMYQEGAIAETFVPTTMKEYIPQQTRWNKSFFREFFWTVKAWNKISLYSLMDTILQPSLFILFTLTLGVHLFIFLDTLDLKVLIYYFALIVLMSSIRGIYGLIRTLNPKFLLFIFYGFIHLFVLIPIRFKALMTLSNNGWGTRQIKKANVYLNYLLWVVLYLLTVVFIAFIVSLVLPDSIWQNLQKPMFSNSASASNFINQLGIDWSSAFFPLAIVSILFIIYSIIKNFNTTNSSFRVQSLIVAFVYCLLVIIAFFGYSSYITNNPRWAQVTDVSEETVRVAKANTNDSSSSKSIARSSSIDSRLVSSSSSKSSKSSSVNSSNSSSKSSSQSSSVSSSQSSSSQNSSKITVKTYSVVAKKGDSTSILIRGIIKQYYQDAGLTLDKVDAIYTEINLVGENKQDLEIGDEIKITQDQITKEMQEAKSLTANDRKAWQKIANTVSY